MGEERDTVDAAASDAQVMAEEAAAAKRAADESAMMDRMDKAAAEAGKAEQENLVLDFDEALREHREAERRLVVRLLGEEYDLPTSTPANFAMFYLRHCLKKVDGEFQFSVPEERFEDFLTLMFGKRFADDLAKSDVEIGFVLRSAVPMVLTAWGLQFTEEALAGKR